MLDVLARYQDGAAPWPDVFVLELSSFQLHWSDSIRPRASVCLNVAVAPEVVHPLTTAMLGDVTSTTEIVVPYYENIPL